MLPELFAAAAGRAIAAGFDGIELHFAHAYTMASFLSALNTRDDGYGGSREHRMRLPREVIAAVRARIGDRGVVGCRYLGDDVIAGGNHVDDAAWFGVELVRAGLDSRRRSRRASSFEDAKQPKVGGGAVYPYTGPSGYECMPTIYSDARGPFARNVGIAGTIRAAVRGAGFATPVVGSGRHLRVRASRSRARERRGRSDRVGAPEPRRSRLVREDARGRGRVDPPLRVHELLQRSARPASRGRSPAKLAWIRDALDAPDVTLAADGKRRLVAPR